MIKGCHHDAGHQGLERTMALMKEQYFWPSMNEDIHSQMVDQGASFESKVIAELCKLAGV